MRLRSLLVNLLVAGLSIGLAAVGAEVLLRAVRPFDLGLWDMTREGLVVLSRSRCVDLSRTGQRICTNSRGMRDIEHPSEKPAGTFRILVLGDSFMEATQVPLEDSFARRLELELKERSDARIEVLNAGVSGWGTDDELAYLQLYGLDLQPDLVLLAMTLHNDLSDNLAMEWHTFEAGELRERELPLIGAATYASLQPKIFLASHSHLYQALLRAWRSRDTAAAAKSLDSQVAALLAERPPPAIELGWSMTDALLEKLSRTCAAKRVPLTIFMIPLWIQVSPERLTAFLDQHGLSRESISLDAPQRHVASWGERHGIPVIDLLPVFASAPRDAPTYLENDGHWSSPGHGLAAHVVAEWIAEHGLVQRSGP